MHFEERGMSALPCFLLSGVAEPNRKNLAVTTNANIEEGGLVLGWQ